jgi:uncharacterized protein
MRIRRIAFATLLCLITTLSLGQVTVSTGSEVPASPEDIRKMFEVMHIRDQMNVIMQQVSQQMRSMEHEQTRKRDSKVTDEDLAKLDAISDEVLKSFSFDGLLDDMIPVYQKHLSKSDVDAMVGFYSTPTGQKILKEMPAMTSEGMQAMQPRLRKMMDDASARIDKMMQEQMEDKKQAKPNTVKN